MSLQGEVLWARTWGTDKQDSFRSLAVGPDGSLWAVGYPSGYPESRGFAAKYDMEGNLLAVRGWNESRSNELEAVCFDPQGQVTIVGRDGPAMLILRIDTAFNLIVGKRRSPFTYASHAFACGYDREGNLFVAGVTDFLSGEWSDSEDLWFTPDGNEGSAYGSVEDIAGATHEPVGVETEPEGVIDEAAGIDDILVVKNYPR